MNFELLNELLDKHNLILKDRLDWWKSDAPKLWHDLLKEVPKIIKIHKQKNQRESCDFNSFMFFHINETLHSKLLAHLLNPNGNHGQGKLFLEMFLVKAGVKEPQKGNWLITAEEGRIDILLRRENPHSVVIIENKSNNAVDQPNQLYRYWKQEIYWPCKKRNINSSKNPEYYKIIYLPPSLSKRPTPNSLTRPQNSSNEALPPTVPLDILQWSFHDQIKEIMEEALDKISENKRMSEYIKQYIELIENL